MLELSLLSEHQSPFKSVNWILSRTFPGLDAQKLSRCLLKVESFLSVLTEQQHTNDSCLSRMFSESFQSLSCLLQWGFSKTLSSLTWLSHKSYGMDNLNKRYKERSASICSLWDEFVFLLVSINLKCKRTFHHQMYCFSLVTFQPHLTIY